MSISYDDFERKVQSLIKDLDSTFLSSDEDPISAVEAIMEIHGLAETEDRIQIVVDCGAIPVLIKHLKTPPPTTEEKQDQYLEEIASAAFMIEKLAHEYPLDIADDGAIPHLLDLLKSPMNNKIGKRLSNIVMDAIYVLSTEHQNIKTHIRTMGGIPLLIELLRSADMELKSSAARAIGALAEDNVENKNQIIECNVLPDLVPMLRSEIIDIQYQGLLVMAILVKGSADAKEKVLVAGALQPIIQLLRVHDNRSRHFKIQKEALQLLGNLVETDPKYKVRMHMVQRGALAPLINMLESPSIEVNKKSTFLLNQLAKNEHTQVGIVQNGGLVQLLNLLQAKHHNLLTDDLLTDVANILFRLAGNEDNVADFVKEDSVSILQDSKFNTGASVEFLGIINDTLRRIEEKMRGWVLEHLLNIMNVGEKSVQARVALTLAHLSSPSDHKTIFIDKNGLGLLLELLTSDSPTNRRKSSKALSELAKRATSLSPLDEAILSSSPQVYVGEQYVNNSALSDVIFLVEGKEFYANKKSLIASSAVFKAMFGGDVYKEKNAKFIEIPNIRWDVFEGMMRYIHTGSTDIEFDIAFELLNVADQYILEDLKRSCEHVLGKGLCFGNLARLLNSSVKYNAMELKQTCLLFILEYYVEFYSFPWYINMINELERDISSIFERLLGGGANS